MNKSMRPLPSLLLLFGPAAAVVAQDMQPVVATHEEALARYRDCIQRVPFLFHTDGRAKLASKRKPEGLQILVQDYATTKAHTEYARYTLATFFGRYYDGADSVALLDDLRRRCDKPVDTWLWVQALTGKARHGGHDEVLAIARTDKSLLHRAAAIAALGEAGRAELAPAILANCIDFPKKDADRSLLVAAMSGALDPLGKRVTEAGFREAMTAYIELLAPATKLSHTTAILMARHLQRLLGGPALFVNPEPWLELLLRGSIAPPKDAHTVVKPSFFGVESDGERFCYVVDMSDSMCKEIAPEYRPQGPVTGPPKKKPKGVLPDQTDIPWHKIRTRFDLAREQLKISLLRLDDSKSFCVVWFGTDAGTLDACKGMTRATKGNVKAAIAELDAIECGPPDPVKAPDGVLRGKTNVHSGLRVAFGMADSGYVDEFAYVAPGPLGDGCDTIFMLSDGAPSWDDFGATDKDYGEGRPIVDTEYGAAAKRQPITNYHGPFVLENWLRDDIVRMNALRRVQIHCVGFGEANMKLLEQIAKDSHATFFNLGHKR